MAKKKECTHEGFYSAAGTFNYQQKDGDMLHGINLFCTNCGQPFLKLTRLEVPKEEAVPQPEKPAS